MFILHLPLSPLGDLRFVALVANLTGLDESSVQTVYARKTYPIDKIRPGECFVDMLDMADNGAVVVHYNRIHQTVPFEHAAE